MTSQLKSLVAKAILLLGSILIAIVCVELLVRLFKPGVPPQLGVELPFRTNPGVKQMFTIDPEIGFRPIIGGAFYNAYGTLINNYPIEKRPGITRVLFIGDSVTQRGEFIEALRRQFGDERYEYWNGGVESFNAVQVVNYYTHYTHQIKPDHVVFTFHNNDFETTPIAFRTFDGNLVVYSPNVPLKEINLTLFRYSYLYRTLLGFWISVPRGREEIVKETQQSLQLLAGNLTRDKIRFTMLLFPVLKPFEQWNDSERFSRDKSLEVAKSLGISCYDLAEPLSSALSKQVKVRESEADIWHPGSEFAEEVASHLIDKGFSLER